MSTLVISDLHVTVAGNQILNGVNLTISSGEVHAVMGPNGAGKSTLSAAIMGKPGYEITRGSVTLDGVDMLALPTWKRAVAGLQDRKSTRLNSSHVSESRMPSSA